MSGQVERAVVARSGTGPFPARWLRRCLPPPEAFESERRSWIVQNIRLDDVEHGYRIHGRDAQRYVELLGRRDGP
jgi:hypothetical protein